MCKPQSQLMSLLGFACLIALPRVLHAASLVTTDVNAVAAFQSGGEVLGFDEIPGNGGGVGGGVAIQSVSQLTTNYSQLGIRFSSSGGPVGVVSVQGLPNQSDARSPYNVIGGSVSNGATPVLNYLAPIIVQFVQPGTTNLGSVNWVGAWNDPTGSRIRLTVYDAQTNQIDSVLADQGSFVGIRTNGIARAEFLHVLNQSVAGFSLDDVSFGPVQWIPTLAIQSDNANALLTWPSAGLYYNLQSTPELTPPMWSTVTNLPATNLNTLSVTLPKTNTSTFFRLKHR